MVPIGDLIKHKYDQKNKNRKCRKMTAQLQEEEEEEDDKLMMQSMMAGKQATITRALLQGAAATATATHTPLKGVATTHASLQDCDGSDHSCAIARRSDR